MKTSGFGFLTVLTLVLGAPLAGSAQDRDLTADTGRGPSYRFGEESQLALSSDAALSIEHTSRGDTTSITLAPAVDYFVMENFSIGGFISFRYYTAGETDTTVFGIGPRVGYNLPLNDSVSIWPKVGFSFSSSSSSTEVGEDEDVEISRSVGNDGIALNLFVPFMFHPAQHFFAGFGPFLDTDLSGDNRATVFGAKLTLGGWFVL